LPASVPIRRLPDDLAVHRKAQIEANRDPSLRTLSASRPLRVHIAGIRSNSKYGSRHGRHLFVASGIIAGMTRWVLPVVLLLAACSEPPMRWQKPGVADPRDAAECRTAARAEAARQLPYGDGPPALPRDVSMLQWTLAIDDERAWLSERLTQACMRDRGFELVSMSARERVEYAGLE
jgi:hypothetical protein